MISKQKLINKLSAEGSKLYAEGDKLCAEGRKLRAEGNKLHAEAANLEKITKWDWICVWIQGYLWEMFHPFATHKQHEDRANQAADKFMERKFGKNWRNGEMGNYPFGICNRIIQGIEQIEAMKQAMKKGKGQ